MMMLEAPAESAWRGYSLAERDRRWQAVRANAAQAGFDAIFVPLCVDPRNLNLSLESSHGVRSDCRYLTQMENAAFILPTDGRPPVVVNESGRGNAWLPEVRPVARGMRGSWAGAMADALLDLGLERARIGVSGLGRGKVTHTRAPDGVVNHSAYAEVLRRLPHATFADATDVVGFARYVKGDEEIACLRRGALICEAGIAKMIEVARPGLDEAVFYARIMGRLLELGSEYYNVALTMGQIDEPLVRYIDPPIGRRLRPMQLITNEVDAVWGGLVAQENQPVLLGPIPDAWQPVIALHEEMFAAGLERMRPGTLFGDFIDFINGYGQQRGLASDLLMHGRGVGNDGPLLTPRDRGDRIRDVPIVENNVFVFKPFAMSADRRIQFVWGGNVLVTARGGERLAFRPHGLVSIT
ncbi:MAG TPA: M24 family metallopeptidase [Chloroflexota bacterium]|nr:M24 family metallopeptidase [Chloroflexota bacterium]